MVTAIRFEPATPGSVSSHYARALQCYVSAERRWRQRSLAFRALSYALFVGHNLLRPCLIREFILESRRHRSAFRELQLRAPLATPVDPSDDAG